ncbi:hypothetical protein [Cellulomonas xylanilytica]|uniref:Uncharacterized protein n=1 Tax=Cellulomonas xylanilytica TaxID=233583 RepID=A0A510V8A7_9CELL|nr:hypothetical protein [Cellulomonas xylanilytica]GEK23097.1 hypothetical protein CXY01_36170 [Cellulomonas xylanilytica]
MASDLRNLLGQARDELGAPHAADDPGLARVVRSVRRRRTQRHAVQSVVGVAAAGAVGVAGWAGLSRVSPPTPADTPSPSVSTTPSPTSTTTPTPTPTPTVPQEEIVGLPPTRPMPPGMLEQTTAGWVLAIYQSTPGPAGDPVEPLVNSVVLASPAGELYRVVDLPLDLGVELVRWDPGSTTALVRVLSPGDSAPAISVRSVLDLTTGEIQHDDRGFPSDTYYQGTTATGAELWAQSIATDAVASELYSVQGDGTPALLGVIGYAMALDPTGRRVVTPEGTFSKTSFSLIDVVAGGQTVHEYGLPGTMCDPVGWLDPDAFLAYCADTNDGDLATNAAAHPAWYRVDVGGASPTTTFLGAADPAELRPQAWSGTWISSGVIAFDGSTETLRGWTGCNDNPYLWQAGSVTPLRGENDTAGRMSSHGGLLYAELWTACDDDGPPGHVSTLAGSRWTDLLPAPSPTVEVPEWLWGVGSWVVATDR